MLAAALLGLSGCAASDPRIQVSERANTSPSQDASAAAALLAEGQLRERFTQLTQAGYDLPDGVGDWASAQLLARDAHIARLRRGDPLTEGTKTNFDDPVATTSPAADWDQAAADLSAAAKSAEQAHREAAVQFAGGTQSFALFYASLATSARDAATAGVAPVPGTAPGPVPDLTPLQSDQLVLTWYWSLIYALDSGLGALDHHSKLFGRGQKRLAEATRAADTLAAALAEDAPTREASYEHDKATTPAEVRASWAAQERSLLGAFARAFAAQAEPEAQAASLDLMIVQRGNVARWGAPLTYWPGYL